LKCDLGKAIALRVPSRPTRGAWIEIEGACPSPCITVRSRPTRGAWIEMGWNSG